MPPTRIRDCFDFDPQRTYACLDSDAFPNDNCGVNCQNCPWWIGVQSIIGHSIDGRRFARSVNSIGPQRVNTRDSSGIVGDVVGGSVYLFPPVSYKQFGVCFVQKPQRIECFDWGICNCFPAPSLVPSPTCPNGSIAPGQFPDCFFANGCDWKPDTWCRPKAENLSHTFDVSRSGTILEQMNSVRAGGSGCTNNWLVMAVGRTLFDPGCSDPTDDNPYHNVDHFVDTTQFGGAGLWDTVWMYWSDPSLVIPDHINDDAKSVLRAKNAMISKVVTGVFPSVLFDRLDNPQPAHGGSTEVWSRGITIRDKNDLVEIQSPTGGPWYPNSYLLPSGMSTPVQLKIRIVNIRMSMILHREKGRVNPGSSNELIPENAWPSIRFEIAIEPVLIFNGGIYHEAELIGVEDGERLILIDHEGFRVQFPHFVYWRGGRGKRIADEWDNIWNDSYDPGTSTDWSISCKLAQSFNLADGGQGYQIGALPDKPDSPIKTRYAGHLRIKFLKTVGWCPGL